MAVRFYEVVAFEYSPVYGQEPALGHYLGKTSDLVFKTEPDKSIDLDNGITEVGSEKLTVSFSILGKFQNPASIGELWLIPIPDHPGSADADIDIIRIHLKNQEYKLEAKSGEFDKIHFEAALKYPVENIAYEVWEDMAGSDFGVCLVELTGNYENRVISISDEQEMNGVVIEESDLIVDGYFAFVYEVGREWYIYAEGMLIESIDVNEYGVIKKRINVP